MENVTLTPKEQTRLQVLNSLMAEHMTLDQAATLMGVTTRHTRRILAAYREKGVSAVAHGHWGRKSANSRLTHPQSCPTNGVYLSRRYHLCPHGRGLPRLGGHHGLVLLVRCRLDLTIVFSLLLASSATLASNDALCFLRSFDTSRPLQAVTAAAISLVLQLQNNNG